MDNKFSQPTLTLEEAADYLQISPEVLGVELEQRRIPGLPIAGTWRISREVLDRLLGLTTDTTGTLPIKQSMSTAQNTSFDSSNVRSANQTVAPASAGGNQKIGVEQPTKETAAIPSSVHQDLPQGRMRAKVLRFNVIEKFGYAKPMGGPAILFESQFQINPNQIPLAGDTIEFELVKSKRGSLQPRNIQIISQDAIGHTFKPASLPNAAPGSSHLSDDLPSSPVAKQSPSKLTRSPIRSVQGTKPTRGVTLPKGQGAYTLAKRAQLEKDYPAAEKYYQQAILEGGDKKESAIKDLAALLQQQNMPEKAIELLQKHRPNMQDKRTVDNILATFLQHMGRHRDAIAVLTRLLESAPEYNKPVILKRIAFCQFKSQDYTPAEKTLRQVLSYRPTDAVAQQWLTALQDATASGEYTVADQVITAPDILADYASELSAFAVYHLDHCDFQGVEPSKISTKEFTESDVDRLENLAKRLGIRRPRERAAYYLSAAKILSLSQNEDDYARMHDYLRRYFASMGDAALADKRHLDVARAFYCESFALSSGPRVWKLEEPNIVLARYLYSFLDQADSLSLLNLRMLSVSDTVKGLFKQYINGSRVFDA